MGLIKTHCEVIEENAAKCVTCSDEFLMTGCYFQLKRIADALELLTGTLGEYQGKPIVRVWSETWNHDG